MAEKKDIFNHLESLKKNNPFEVPENYFKSVSGNIMDKIKAEEEKSLVESDLKLKVNKPVWTLIRNQMAIAASFAALFLLAYTAIRIINPQPVESQLNLEAVYASLESELYYIDESTLFEISQLSTETSEFTIDELSDQDIIEYLSLEGADLDDFTEF